MAKDKPADAKLQDDHLLIRYIGEAPWTRAQYGAGKTQGKRVEKNQVRALPKEDAIDLIQMGDYERLLDVESVAKRYKMDVRVVSLLLEHGRCDVAVYDPDTDKLYQGGPLNVIALTERTAAYFLACQDVLIAAKAIADEDVLVAVAAAKAKNEARSLEEKAILTEAKAQMTAKAAAKAAAEAKVAKEALAKEAAASKAAAKRAAAKKADPAAVEAKT